MKSFLERLGRERLYCDEGTGSLLQAKGLKGGELPEWWNLTHPDVMTDVARSYFEAGSDIVVTNTFGANRLHYPEHLEEIVKEAVAHVREGMRLAGREDGYVALDLGPTGRLMKPMGDLDFEEAVRLFAEVVRYGADAGADLVSIETMGDTLEAKAAVLAVKENCGLPVTVTMVYDSKGRMLTGGTVESVVPMFEGLGVDALGLNCSLGPKQLLPIAEKLVKTASVPVICNPNAGLPRQENGQTVYDLSPEDFAEAMVQIAEAGVHVIGGCCGTTPEYIRETVRRTRDLPFQEPVRKYRTAVSSFSRVVEIGRRPVLIGNGSTRPEKNVSSRPSAKMISTTFWSRGLCRRTPGRKSWTSTSASPKSTNRPCSIRSCRVCRVSRRSRLRSTRRIRRLLALPSGITTARP